jgi:hypothetical protein
MRETGEGFSSGPNEGMHEEKSVQELTRSLLVGVSAAMRAEQSSSVYSYENFSKENIDRPLETRSCVSSLGPNLILREKLAARLQERRSRYVGSTKKYHQEKGAAEDSADNNETISSTQRAFQNAPRSRLVSRAIMIQEKTSISRLQRKIYRDKLSHQHQLLVQETPVRQHNSIKLHIYDLILKDTRMMLPWGCVCAIGKCFTDVNSALHELGTGAYHVGVEVNGIEYAYGATIQSNKTGIFTCIPRLSPGYQYRTSIDFGDVPLIRSSWVVAPEIASPRTTTSDASYFRLVEKFVDGRQVIKEMTGDYMGIDYDILRKNCCTFAYDACVRLGVPAEQIPNWFRNLAETGRITSDTVNATLQPLHKVLSQGCDIDKNSICEDTETEEPGFEIITKRNAADTRDVVIVIGAEPNRPARWFNRTTTWAY